MGDQLQERVLLVFAVTFTVFMFLMASVPHAAAGRALEGEQWASRNHGAAQTSTLLLDKLPKGPVTPSTGSPCTNIPGQGTGHCMFINGINVAGRVVRSMPTFPPAGLSPTWRAFRAAAMPVEQ